MSRADRLSDAKLFYRHSLHAAPVLRPTLERASWFALMRWAGMLEDWPFGASVYPPAVRRAVAATWRQE